MDHGIHTFGALRAAGLPRREVDALPRIGGLRGLRAMDGGVGRSERLTAALAAAPEGAVLAGWAAAALHGVPIDMIDGTYDGRALVPVPFLVPERCGLRAREGLTYWKGPLARAHVVCIDGVPVTSGPRTVIDLARWSRYPARAQAMVDIGFRHGLTDGPQLRRTLESMRGYRGIALARDAAREPTSRAASPRESELRYYWMEAGLPEPLVNVVLVDLRGNFLGCVDLMDRQSGFVGEYDGWYHTVGDQPERDAQRLSRLRAANLTVEVFTEADFSPVQIGGVGGRLRNAWLRAKERDARRDFWRLA